MFDLDSHFFPYKNSLQSIDDTKNPWTGAHKTGGLPHIYWLCEMLGIKWLVFTWQPTAENKGFLVVISNMCSLGKSVA